MKEYHEEYHINPKRFDPASDRIQFHCAFHSCWKPGFVGQSSGGGHAIYSLVKSGGSCVFSVGRTSITRAVCFSYSRSRRQYQYAESLGPDDFVRKAVMVRFNAFHEMISSHYLPLPHGKLPLVQPGRVEKILDAIYDELGRKRPDEALLSGLFVQMLHEVCAQQKEHQRPETLNAALDYITDNLQNPELSRAGIARHCGVSVRTLSRLFHEQLALPVAQYVIRLRLEQVCGMLGLPRLSIKEIAARCGFRSAGFLTSQFRRHYGVTPKEYRRKLFARADRNSRGSSVSFSPRFR